MKNFNLLTNADAELLALLLEELGEAQQAIGKILRHGYESHNPDLPDSVCNAMALERELGHVQAAVTLLVRSDRIFETEINKACAAKLKNVGAYLHHNKVPQSDQA